MTAQRQPAPWTPEQLHTALAIARSHASREARQFRLARADRDDLIQDLLLIMLARSGSYETATGTWHGFLHAVARHALLDRRRARRRAAAITFLPVALDLFPDGASATSPAATRSDLALDLQRLAEDLPAGPGSLLRLIQDATGVAEAQRTAAMSSSVFYRALGDLRWWLRASGVHRPDARRCRQGAQQATVDG